MGAGSTIRKAQDTAFDKFDRLKRQLRLLEFDLTHSVRAINTTGGPVHQVCF